MKCNLEKIVQSKYTRTTFHDESIQVSKSSDLLQQKSERIYINKDGEFMSLSLSIFKPFLTLLFTTIIIYLNRNSCLTGTMLIIINKESLSTFLLYNSINDI